MDKSITRQYRATQRPPVFLARPPQPTVRQPVASAVSRYLAAFALAFAVVTAIIVLVS